MCVLMCNFVSYFVCVILCIFVFLCNILLPSGVINDNMYQIVKWSLSPYRLLSCFIEYNLIHFLSLFCITIIYTCHMA